MIQDFSRSAHERRAAKQKIEVIYSTVPRKRPHDSILTGIAVAAMFVACVGFSGARAETAVVPELHVLTLTQAAPSAQEKDRPAPGRGRPPREAMEACANKPAKSACDFAGRDGEMVSGNCRAPQPDAPQACVPVRKPQKG